MQAYLALLKGFMSVQILYMPKNIYNGGYAFSLFAMLISFAFTLFSLLKLIESRAKVQKKNASYSDIAEEAFGKIGRTVADVLLCLLQYSYVITLNFFVIETLRSVINEYIDAELSLFFVGKDEHV
jgi:amino acid permease